MDQKKPNPLCPVVVLSNVDMIAMMPELRFIDELYHVIENRLDLENAQDKEQFEKQLYKDLESSLHRLLSGILMGAMEDVLLV